jgi:fatty-acid desaturase
MSTIPEGEGAAAPTPVPTIAEWMAMDLSHTAHERQKLAKPVTAMPLRIAWIDAAGLLTVHVLALLAFVPWCFSWTGVVLAFLGLQFRNARYRPVLPPHADASKHRVSEMARACARRHRRVLSSGYPARWVAIHRQHHHQADEEPDPHSPLVHFLWAHMGWLIFKNRDTTRLRIVSRYARDIMRDPFYSWLERNFNWVRIVLASWAAFFVAGFIAQLLSGGGVLDALQFGLSLLVWGALVRTVLVWHVTWSVNSVTHLWGYRNYETKDSSRNNLIVGFLTNGEGWHNNHHADPRSAKHGHRWWELDVTWLTIRLLMAVGLAREVVTPSPTNASSMRAIE